MANLTARTTWEVSRCLRGREWKGAVAFAGRTVLQILRVQLPFEIHPADEVLRAVAGAFDEPGVGFAPGHHHFYRLARVQFTVVIDIEIGQTVPDRIIHRQRVESPHRIPGIICVAVVVGVGVLYFMLDHINWLKPLRP